MKCETSSCVDADMKKPIVLFSTPILHRPPMGGPELRIENSIKALSQVADLYIYNWVPLSAMGGRSALSHFQQYCNSFYFAPSSKSFRILIEFAKRVANLIGKQTLQRSIIKLAYESSAKDFDDLLRIADEIQADAIWLGYGNLLYSLLEYIKYRSDYRVVVDTDSVWSRFILRGLPYVGTEREREKIEQEGRDKEKEERWGTVLADITTAVSEMDASYYRLYALSPERVQIFSNVVDLDNYRAVPTVAQDLKKPCIYLAGSFWKNSPMEDAVRWIIENVLPNVRHQVPDIHFYIVGKGSKQVLSDIDDQSITITGTLPSVLPYLCYADIAIVPLRFESGTRFKILEAGACKIPVVSTTLGAEGLPVEHEEHLLLADEPEEFVSAIIRLIRNRKLALELTKNLHQLISDQYSIPTAVREAKTILGHLRGNGTPTPQKRYQGDD